MSVQMTSQVSDFYEGSTKVIRVKISKDGVLQDISADTVNIMFKTKKTDLDSAALINADADVITNGINGEATFNLTPVVTNINPGTYFYQIIWTEATGEKNPAPVDKVKVLEAIYDTP